MVASQEQIMLRDSAAGWLRENAPIAAMRALRGQAEGPGFDPALYQAMADMGWTGVVVPEADGGFGFGHAGMGLIAGEMGRSLVLSPLIQSAVVGAGALSLAGTAEQKDRWLPRLIAGEIHAALALEEGPHHDPAMTALAAVADGSGWKLNGIKRPVFDAPGAALLLVAARTSGQPGDTQGLTLFLCPADSAGIALTRLDHIDSRSAAIVSFDNVRLDGDCVLGSPDAGFALLDRVLDRGRAVLAAEMLGGAQQAFEATMDYLRTRVQFDKVIGTFQALQHRAADLLARLEMTRSAVEAALTAIDEDTPDQAALASLAKALAGATFRKVAQEMIQLHGGIGMTDEHDSGLFLKRAQVADMTWGNAAFHRDRYARLIGL